MNDIPDLVIAVFNEALRLTPVERAAYLDRACASDEELRQQVERLLRAYEKAGGFLVEPVTLLRDGTAPSPPTGKGPGDRVGKYKLLQQIGEGGCGVVFMAEQEEPVRRRVALKVVKPGMDTRNVIARFESERQALALMEHPNIAQVFDAGATDTGRPYFVMELVRGAKINDYCDQNSLTTKARLELFVQVCHAIQHAHQKGIIHRDIKPSNILVTTTGEGVPLPKVIDFGIAKATTGQQLTDKTFFTAFEMLIGTPAYMSPEQAALTSVDVDTRSDIYSLGVLLYELLTGTTPFDVRELFKVGLDEIRRVILNKDPIRPSTRLKTMQIKDLTMTAQHRQIEPLRLIRVVRGDLDWIVMKALEKDRARRYPTANALAMDVKHHLANEPVAARPPSAFYKLGKLVARNRLLFGSLIALGVLLATSLVIMSALFAREQAAHQQAEAEKRNAQTEAVKNKQVTVFISEMLAGVVPEVAKGRDTAIMRNILDRTSKRVTATLTNQPDVEAEVRLKLGIIYQKVGDYESAERMLRRAMELHQMTLSPNTAEFATAQSRLGLVLLQRRRFEEAERELKASLELWRKLRAEEDREAVLTLEYFAMLRYQQGRLDEAEFLMRRVCALREKSMPPDDPEVITALNNLASVLYTARKLPQAEELFRQVFTARQQRYDDEHLSVAFALQSLGALYSQQGKVNEAKEVLTRSVVLQRKFLEKSHPQLAASLARLAELHRSSGNLAEAEVLFFEALMTGRQQPDQYNHTVIYSLNKLVPTMLAQGKIKELDSLFVERLGEEFTGSDKSAPVLRVHVEFLARTGRWREAATGALRLIELQPAEHEHYHTLAPVLVADGQLDAYKNLCAGIVARFGDTTNMFVADRMAKDCLIHPAAAAKLTAVAAMADTALKAGVNEPSLPFFQACKALAEYRQGHFGAAAEWAQKVDDSIPHAAAESSAVLAMALHRLNKTESARAQLARCAAIVGTQLPKLDAGDLGEDWKDLVIARALHAEARVLIESTGR